MKKNNLKKTFLLILGIVLIYSCSKEKSWLIDDFPDAVINNDPADAPPRFLDEIWNGHSQQLYREYLNSNVAVYYDENVDRDIIWTRDFTSDFWDYVQNTYGGYEDSDILYAVFHSEAVEPFASNIFNDAALNTYLIDLTLKGAEINSQGTDAILKLLAKIVETSSFGINKSPASEIWQEKWSEIFLYDAYKTLGMEAEAQRIYDAALESSVNYPAANTYWFRDWFYPIYENYEGNSALNNFFRVSSNTFPLDGNAYARSMNMGEFVHFFSGATGEDLQPLAEEAFGWSEEWQAELIQARTNFPDMNYPFEPTSELIDLTTEATLTVSKDNGEGPEGREGSLKLVDNDINTKFLAGGFPADFTLWLQQEFSEPQVVNRYTLTSGNDAPERDPTIWEFQASNDGANWEVLETRMDESWSERNQTREFVIDNDQAYKYYRLFITENGGSDAVQISEWRLFNLEILGPPEPEDFSSDAIITVSNDNGDGPDGAEGSFNIIDNDLDSKFLVGGFHGDIDFWMQQELSEAKIINMYTITSGNDAPDRDPVDWEFLGSNDGASWEILDTRTGNSFDERNKTYAFYVDNEKAYKYYRIAIETINGSDAFQVMEWRLLNSVL